ncbi:MAG: type restriction enzyme protein [Pyrinomonadaceae bacterium]|nr:type restriction enzyme protein [Pyrinomonadaceae bacterium]
MSRKTASKKKAAKALTSQQTAVGTSNPNEFLSSALPKPERNAKGEVYCPLLKEYRSATPEELVRQSYLLHLHQHYNYSFDQMLQEQRQQAGKRSPRVDIVIWESPEVVKRESPKIVVECKAETVGIHQRDYYQGESYARATGAEILVMHNARQTSIFNVVRELMPGELVQINDLPRAEDWGNAKRIEAIKNSTRAFSRDEFRDLLFRCHSILRDVHKMEPGKAFDTISKILFIKMYIERAGTWGTFTTDFIRQRQKTRLPDDAPVHEQLFQLTRQYYEPHRLFSKDDRLDEISEDTFTRTVKELERFNLSATGDDVKGIAFEKFLGETFRGNLGQFFTPRTVVDFMVQLLDPGEDDLVCDPCAGSGGFLIRAFEHVRSKIETDVQIRKDAVRAEIEAMNLSEQEEEELVNQRFTELNLELEPEQDEPPSRIYRLAHERIFGTDAEPRAARTAKMNMIMHGDGHGGIHFHDGLLNINGVYPERFDIVLTNPPFGSNVGEDQKVGDTEQTYVSESPQYVRQSRERYGDDWYASHQQMVRASRARTPLLNLFEIGENKANRPTEIIFLERCLQLLKPGGRLGIVLPDGNLNNPSLSWLRRWAEGKAKLIAVVSLPEETFKSAAASVKASLVFLRKFNAEESQAWDAAWQDAHDKFDAGFNEKRTEVCTQFGSRINCGDEPELSNLLEQLAGLGVQRTTPTWRLKPPPPYPRGFVQTEIVKSRWEGTPKKREDKAKARTLREQFDERWTNEIEERSNELIRELRAGLRRVDREQFRLLWREVRTALDYPVFTAAPEQVGITATGAQGPSQLPDVLRAYRMFESWVNAGARESERPQFA